MQRMWWCSREGARVVEESVSLEKPDSEVNSRHTEWPDDWPAWVRQIADEMAKAETLPLDVIPFVSRKWVARMAEQVFVPALLGPGAIDSEEPGARIVGRIIGHQIELIQTLPMLGEKSLKAMEEFDEKLRAKLNAKAYARLLKSTAKYTKGEEKIIEALEGTLERKCEAMKRAMSAACEQPINESGEYFRGVSEALENRIFNEEGKFQIGGTRYQLYSLLLTWWRLVEDFKNSSQLYNWCCVLLGQANVGDLATFQRLCRRNEIRLGARGKPLKKRKMRKRNRQR